MAGVTDLPFRRQADRFGAPYVVSEMVASAELAKARPDVVRRAAGEGLKGPLVTQLAGRDPEWMRVGARLAEDCGADVIDINMGCPAKCVTSGQAGSALMREPDLALRLIEAVAESVATPVTVKMRLGWDETQLNAPDIARRAQSAGARMIVVHGRTRKQFYNGAADWAAIAETVAAVSIPVIANGDIRTADDARTALRLSGASGVMIGRGAQGRPWAPAALARALSHGGDMRDPPMRAILDSLLALYEDSLAFYGQHHGLKVARKHIAWSIDAFLPKMEPTLRRRMRADVCMLDDPQAVREALSRLFGGPWAEAA
jgi:nifR3 family TIM-barrel protein